jgi:hypothetical protein
MNVVNAVRIDEEIGGIGLRSNFWLIEALWRGWCVDQNIAMLSPEEWSHTDKYNSLKLIKLWRATKDPPMRIPKYVNQL